MNDWSSIRWFKPEEFGDPHYLGSGKHADFRLVKLLDKLRWTLGCPIRVHSSVGGGVDVDGTWGHAEKSFHRVDMGAKAADIDIVTDMPLRQQYYHVCQMGFPGVGLYTWWKRPGFHVDTRPIEICQHWLSRVKGHYQYIIPKFC